MYERMRIFGIVLIICYTPLKKIFRYIIAPVFSFMWGFFLMSCIISLGVAGLFVGLASVLPHGILYGMIVWILMVVNGERRYYIKDRIVKDVIRYIFCVLLFITGCVLESVIATHFIPWIIRLSLI